MSKIITAMALLMLPPVVLADFVIEDKGVGMNQKEIEMIVQSWEPNMREEAASNDSARFDLMEQALANKRLADEIDKISPETEPDFYWKSQLALRSMKLKLYLEYYRNNIKVPDLTDLAKEQFNAYRDRYAAVPETRDSSHILVKCLPGVCDRKIKRPIAEKILVKLKNGANFEELVEKHSEDPGSKARKGSLGKWVKKGEPHIVGEYLAGLFAINKESGYSQVVESRFGFHIIRLDGLKKASYKTFEEVKPKIVEVLENKYKQMEMIEYNKSFALSDNAKIDLKALDKLFAPYKEDKNKANNKTSH